MSGPSPTPPLLGRLLLRLCRLGDRRSDITADMIELFHARVVTMDRRVARRRFNADAWSVWWRRRRPVDRMPWSRPRWQWIADLPTDLSYAARIMRKQAGVVTTAVVGLGVAIGLTTTVFSLANTFTLKPLGVAHPERVVVPSRTVGANRTPVAGWSPQDFAVLQPAVKAMTLAASVESRVVVGQQRGEAEAQRVRVRFVSDGFLAPLGAATVIGRLPDPTDSRPGAPPVAVLNHQFWQVSFSSDQAIIGRNVFINGHEVTVVGVMVSQFTGPFDANSIPAAWLPFETARVVDPLAAGSGGHPGWVDLVGVLAGRATVRQAEAEVETIATVAGLVVPGSRGASGVALRPAGKALGIDDLLMLMVLLLIASLVVVLAATNVANLLLASSVSRRPELAMRLALGASRGRIVRQLLAESLSIAAVGGVLGAVVASWLARMAGVVFVLPQFVDLSPDWRVYTFAAAISLLAGVAAGLSPALQGTRDLAAFTARPGIGRDNRTRSVFLGVQAAASVFLVLLTVLCTRALLEVSSREIGFDPNRLVALTAFSPLKTHTVPDNEFFPLAQERIAAMPAVRGTALANYTPFEGAYQPIPTALNGADYPLIHIRTTPAYFGVVGHQLVQGRFYTADEVRTRAGVAVVTSRFARDFFPDGDALGSSLGRVRDYLAHLRVIGVVTNAAPHIGSPKYSSSEVIFSPLTEWTAARIIVGTSDLGADRLGAFREALIAIDAGRTITAHVTREDFERQMSGPRLLARMSGLVGGLAVLLAVIGMYGVTAFTVHARRRDIGIRLALGATRRRVVGEVIGATLRPVLMGISAGLLLALLGGTIIGFFLYAGVSPRDPMSFAIAALTLVLTAGLGTLGPARRAATVDPAITLKTE